MIAQWFPKILKQERKNYWSKIMTVKKSARTSSAFFFCKFCKNWFSSKNASSELYYIALDDRFWFVFFLNSNMIFMNVVKYFLCGFTVLFSFISRNSSLLWIPPHQSNSYPYSLNWNLTHALRNCIRCPQWLAVKTNGGCCVCFLIQDKPFSRRVCEK